ncbi:MAG: DUF1318 domain-containing protein [Desulfococcaceae bacterium]|jgi:uncharacterized protein YdbL (DUF1318 family)|nr:DUF1318 domain-containing protein [Desulfococcaceae bacterium]
MKTKTACILLIFFVLGIFFQTAAFAEGIKERMKNRLPVINDLKDRGVIGENNKGFLEFRGPREKADVVNAENADRARVYGAIAKQQKTSAALVGKRRAIQIRNEVAGPGEWLQDDKGKWYKK